LQPSASKRCWSVVMNRILRPMAFLRASFQARRAYDGTDFAAKERRSTEAAGMNLPSATLFALNSSAE
jgi:hypothetical protein